MSQPHFERMWGWHSHSWNGDLGVPRDLEYSKLDCRGQNTSSWGVLYTIGNDLESEMSKMALHEPFGHLQHKLCTQEGSGVKLPIWLPTTKSQESTRPRCVQVKCDTPLESSWGELQVFFRPHLNWRSKQKLMNSQSPGNSNWDSFETPPWESKKKSHSDIGATE